MRSRSPRMVRARIAPSGPVIGHPTPPAAERRVYRETQGKARRLLWLAGLVQCVVSGRTQFFLRGSSESRRVGRRPAELVPEAPSGGLRLRIEGSIDPEYPRRPSLLL